MTDPLPPTPLLCLASGSPRRQELLRQMGVPFRTTEANIDESVHSGEDPQDYVRRVARAKAAAVQASGRHGGLPVLGADTSVVLDGVLLGKPQHAEDAQRMLWLLSGRVHQVLSAVVLLWHGGTSERLSISQVRFAPLDARRIEAYVASGEPFGKAGGYAIQGRAAAFIAHLDGSYSGVMGLPLYETACLLSEAGLA